MLKLIFVLSDRIESKANPVSSSTSERLLARFIAQPNNSDARIDLSPSISPFIVVGNERMENSHKFQSRDGNSITDWSETILIEKITMKTIAARAPSRDETGEQKTISSPLWCRRCFCISCFNQITWTNKSLKWKTLHFSALRVWTFNFGLGFGFRSFFVTSAASFAVIVINESTSSSAPASSSSPSAWYFRCP